MIETFLRLLDKLIELISERRLRREAYFGRIVEPLFQDLQIVVDNYLLLFRESGAKVGEIRAFETRWQVTSEERAAFEVLEEVYSLERHIGVIDSEYFHKDLRCDFKNPERYRLLEERTKTREKRDVLLADPRVKRAQRVAKSHTKRREEFEEEVKSQITKCLKELRRHREIHARTRVRLVEMAKAMEEASRPDDEILSFGRAVLALFRSFDQNPHRWSTKLTELVDFFEFVARGSRSADDLLNFIGRTIEDLEENWKELSRLYSRLRLAQLT